MPKRTCPRCQQQHRPLRPQHRRFAELYLVHYDATKSAIEAGFSKRSAKSIGHATLQRPEVRCYLESLQLKQTERLQVDADDILTSLLRIARFDIADIMTDDGSIKPLSYVPPEIRRAIAGAKFKDGKLVEIKIPDKVRSLELLGKHKRIFADVNVIEGELSIRERIARGRRRAMGRGDSEETQG